MASGIRDFGFVFGSRFLTMFMSIGTQICLARTLEPAGSGSYDVCLVFTTILNILFMFGCEYAAQYYVASKRFTVSEGITNTLVCNLCGTLLAVIAGLIAIQLPLKFFEKASQEQFHLALLLIPFSAFCLAVMETLNAVRDFSRYALVSVCASVLQFSLILVAVVILQWSVTGALLATLTCNMVTIVIVLLILRQRHGFKFVKPSLKCILEMLHYGIRYYFGRLAAQVNFRLGAILLAMFATEEQIGLFGRAVMMTGMVLMVPDNLMSVLMPRVAGDKAGRPELIAKCARISGIVCGVLLAMLAIFASPVVSILFGAKFLPIVPVIRILAIGFLIWGTCKIFVPYLLGTNHPGILSMALIPAMGVNVLLLLNLLPIMGLSGAAVAMVAGYCVSSSIVAFAFKFLSKLKIIEIFGFNKSDWSVIMGGLRALLRKIYGTRAKHEN